MKKLVGLFIFVLVLGQLAMGQKKAAKDCTVAEIDSILEGLKEDNNMLLYAEIGKAKSAKQYGKADTSYAKMLYFLGHYYWYEYDFEQAEPYFKEAIAIQRTKMPKSPKYARTLNNLAALYKDMSNYALAEPLYKEAMKIRKEVLGEKSPEYASSLNNLGTCYFHIGNYALAEPLYKEAMKIRKEVLGEKHPDYAISLNHLATYYVNIGNYALAEPLYKEALKIRKEVLGEKSPEYANSLNNLAILHYNTGKYSLAEPLYKEALKIRKEVWGEKSPEYASSLNNLAILYVYIGNYALAEPLHKEALKIRKEVWGEKHPEYITSLNNLANCYVDIGNYVLAESLYREALKIRKEVLGEKHPDYANSLNNLGYLYFETDNYALAEPLYKEALKIRKEVLGEKHPDYASSLNNLANLYDETGNYALVEPLHKEALKIRKEVLGEKHPDYILSLYNLANLYQKWDNQTESWAYIQQSLIANIGQEISLDINQAWADSLIAKDYISVDMMLLTLETSYTLLAKKNTGEAKTTQAIVAELVLKILEKARDDFSDEGDKLRNLSKSSEWVLNGLAVLDLDKEGGKGFIFAEQSKSVLLLNAAQTKQAYTFGDLPDSLAQKEKKLQQQKANYEAAMAENRPKVQIDSLRSLLNNLNLDIKDFKATIEKLYPKYAELKYQHKEANIADIQKLLDAKTALIEYVVGNTATYIFYLDKKQLKISRLDISADSLKTQTEKLHHCLSNYAEIKDDQAKAYRDYTEIAHWFYENMLAAPLKNAENIQHLIIIPDGDLSHLPFETFLRTKAEPNGNYSDLAYVVNDFSVSYNYSATLWKQNLTKKKRENNGKMLGIAANYATKLDSSKFHLRLPADSRLRKLLNVLPAAQEEVKSLSEAFSGEFLFDNSASEKAFKANAGKYSIIHLAMHGLLDNQNPILSSLAFTENGDSIENNFLHAYEISKMQLNADLVVLSACETGFGKFEKGNGTASLARAFMYAGVPALIVSLWEVNDGSTKILMQLFYSNLAAGMDKSEALRQAKLKYINDANGSAAHPAFWSAFVQVGDSEPINMYGGGSKWLFWAIGAAVALGLIGVVLYARNKKS
jgi:CHAT domain-containing protein/Tfp pilus assembly protein PilF